MVFYRSCESSPMNSQLQTLTNATRNRKTIVVHRFACTHEMIWVTMAKSARGKIMEMNTANSCELLVNEIWWAHMGSNHGPRSYQERALPLSHAPKIIIFTMAKWPSYAYH